MIQKAIFCFTKYEASDAILLEVSCQVWLLIHFAVVDVLRYYIVCDSDKAKNPFREVSKMALGNYI